LSEEINILNYEVGGLEKDRIEVDYNNLKKVIEMKRREREETEIKFIEINKEISRIESNIEIKKEKLEELKKEISELEVQKEKIKNIEAIYTNNPENFLKEKEKKLEKYKEEKYELIARIKEVESSLSSLKLSGSKCPVCESYLQEDRKKDIILHKEKHLLNIKNRVAEIEKYIVELEKEVNEIKTLVEKYKEIKKSLENFVEIEKSINNLSTELTSLENSLFKKTEEKKDAENKLNRIKTEIESLEKLLENIKRKLEKIEELERRKLKIEEKINEAKVIQEKIKLVEKSIPPNLEDIKKTYEKVKEEIHFLEIENEKLKGRGNLIEKELENIIKEINRVEKIENEIKTLESYNNFIQKFIKSLTYTQSEIRNYFIKNSNNILSQIWRELYPYSKYVDIQVYFENNDYVIKIKDNFNRWHDLGKCSGGEQVLANLCFRIALASIAAPNVKILLLDEPTHNLDEKAIEFLKNSLSSNLNKFVDQIILITHEESMQDVLASKIYRVETNELDESIVKKIN
ncbi:MAG: hypothetical protein RMJ17_03970, partial [Candidatus Aenigmarchaeota archaeon]|nr:hypothetical protein [Candidatus Aenigmarchaeota archaeon]MDW8149716.1 hypothetical protein [Candidatus Aenigmarchaeota archaeon]